MYDTRQERWDVVVVVVTPFVDWRRRSAKTIRRRIAARSACTHNAIVCTRSCRFSRELSCGILCAVAANSFAGIRLACLLHVCMYVLVNSTISADASATATATHQRARPDLQDGSPLSLVATFFKLASCVFVVARCPSSASRSILCLCSRFFRFCWAECSSNSTDF